MSRACSPVPDVNSRAWRRLQGHVLNRVRDVYESARQVPVAPYRRGPQRRVDLEDGARQNCNTKPRRPNNNSKWTGCDSAALPDHESRDGEKAIPELVPVGESVPEALQRGPTNWHPHEALDGLFGVRRMNVRLQHVVAKAELVVAARLHRAFGNGCWDPHPRRHGRRRRRPIRLGC